MNDLKERIELAVRGTISCTVTGGEDTP